MGYVANDVGLRVEDWKRGDGFGIHELESIRDRLVATDLEVRIRCHVVEINVAERVLD